jgi:FtsZ-binding cell division protein ZapB
LENLKEKHQQEKAQGEEKEPQRSNRDYCEQHRLLMKDTTGEGEESSSDPIVAGGNQSTIMLMLQLEELESKNKSLEEEKARVEEERDALRKQQKLMKSGLLKSSLKVTEEMQHLK